MVQQCAQQRPVQNSEVYVLRQVPPFPPLSPPSPITPAEDFDDPPIDAHGLSQPDIAVCGKKLAVEERLARAVHVLATETTALQNLTELYSSDRVARDGFSRAVDAVIRSQSHRAKVVIIGVGKSGHIAKKLVATFNSLAIQAVFLHPTEALHGDLGQLSRHDTLLLITFSGKTPELLALLPHLDRSYPLILLTGHTGPETCELVRHRPDTILLPAPVHEAETRSFGVAAPTTSTTVAVTVGDALALVAARELHACVASVFARNHPGGAIGAALWSKPRDDVRTVMVPLDQIPVLAAADNPGPVPTEPPPPPEPAPLTALDVLRAAYASPSGWLRLPHFPRLFQLPDRTTTTTTTGIRSTSSSSSSSNGGRPKRDATGTRNRASLPACVLAPRKIRRIPASAMALPLGDPDLAWLATPGSAFIPVAADTTVARAAEWVRGLRVATAAASFDSDASGLFGDGSQGLGEDGPYGDEAVIAVMEKGECVGLLEVGKLLEDA